jgi:hypothetical protein
MAASRIALATCPAEKLCDYFPTAAEPGVVPVEPPFAPDDQVAVDELRRAGVDVEPVVWAWQLCSAGPASSPRPSMPSPPSSPERLAAGHARQSVSVSSG